MDSRKIGESPERGRCLMDLCEVQRNSLMGPTRLLTQNYAKRHRAKRLVGTCILCPRGSHQMQRPFKGPIAAPIVLADSAIGSSIWRDPRCVHVLQQHQGLLPPTVLGQHVDGGSVGQGRGLHPSILHIPDGGVVGQRLGNDALLVHAPDGLKGMSPLPLRAAGTDQGRVAVRVGGAVPPHLLHEEERLLALLALLTHLQRGVEARPGEVGLGATLDSSPSAVFNNISGKGSLSRR
mmetsp:Transcript_148825/g.476639  ORF Transcript_148825/g.476639 Transcript_148825/m.476639 type:complete len:236 (+) Transcript_148825:1-708(+)